MSEKKVLIIDDSALMRRVLSDIINSQSRLKVGDVASNGVQAMELLLHGRRYDAIIADIHMPKMNGVEFLKEMNRQRIQIPVIMISSVSDEGARETIEALSLGAFE